MKEFYPNLEYNRAKRRSYFALLMLGLFFLGGTAATFFVMKQAMIGLIIGILAIVALSTVPSALTNYPVKNNALIKVEKNKITLYGKEEYKVSDVLAVSVLIDVPQIRGTKEHKMEYLKKIASTKPTQPVVGTCDLLVKDSKGKEVTKYNIIADSIGGLEALLSCGVKKYRLVYYMKKLSMPARYGLNIENNEVEKNDLASLDEKDKLMQLL